MKGKQRLSASVDAELLVAATSFHDPANHGIASNVCSILSGGLISG
jgi:hypothetical protein